MWAKKILAHGDDGGTKNIINDKFHRNMSMCLLVMEQSVSQVEEMLKI